MLTVNHRIKPNSRLNAESLIIAGTAYNSGFTKVGLQQWPLGMFPLMDFCNFVRSSKQVTAKANSRNSNPNLRKALSVISHAAAGAEPDSLSLYCVVRLCYANRE